MKNYWIFCSFLHSYENEEQDLITIYMIILLSIECLVYCLATQHLWMSMLRKRKKKCINSNPVLQEANSSNNPSSRLSLGSPCYGHFNDFVIRALVIYALWAEIHLAKKYNGMAEIRIRGWQIKLFWWLWACMALHHNISSAVARGAAKAIGRKRWSVRN